MRTFHIIWKVLRLNLYFNGTQAYVVVARSFTAFGGSYAPDNNIIIAGNYNFLCLTKNLTE